MAHNRKHSKHIIVCECVCVLVSPFLYESSLECSFALRLNVHEIPFGASKDGEKNGKINEFMHRKMPEFCCYFLLLLLLIHM